MQRGSIHFTPTHWVILIGIIYYLITVSLVALTHEHDYYEIGSEHCSACFFSANHVGIEFHHAVHLTNLNTCTSIHIPNNFIFIPTILDNSVQSRAPPALSV